MPPYQVGKRTTIWVNLAKIQIGNKLYTKPKFVIMSCGCLPNQVGQETKI